MTELALKTRVVTKTYLVSGGAFRTRRKLKAVNGVSLNVTKGSVLGLTHFTPKITLYTKTDKISSPRPQSAFADTIWDFHN